MKVLGRFSLAISLFSAIVLLASPVGASESADVPNATVDPTVIEGLEYRSLGFSRGGRSTAVAGVPSDPMTYYFGTTGGGVWKTEDAGLNWEPISDGFFEAGSIGAIEVAESDPNVIFVGTGSACPRGNISAGVGVYKSTDAGKTWTHSGLPEAGQIGKIRIHPRDENLVYVAALGHIFGPNEERGVYRSKDGGKTWDKVLHVSEKTGAVDLSMDANNPRIIYAAMWTVERKPWTIRSGSEEGGLFKTTDGGDSWTKVEGGLPSGVVGKIAVAVSPADSERVWALVEAPGNKGGIFRSDDGGESWTRINRERRFLQRAWYYIHIYADPVSPETVYVLNTGFYRSTDGGRSYQSFRVPHGDNHDLWINPSNPKIMVNANDGGANVSMNGAESWTGQMGQPTAEFYRVSVDDGFPYRVYGAQQDNSTASVSSRGASGGRGAPGFYSVGGGESGHIAVDPRGNHIVYAGSYGGTITRMDTRTRLSRSIRTYPESQTGQRAADMKYRFQWNAPIRISPHNPDVVYHASQYVHRSSDQGESWEIISPDLTRNDKEKQDYSGGPITRDNTGVEVYGTIFAFEESPHQAGLLWVGSDDGRVHISRDNGKKWDEITPPGMPEWGVVNMIDLSAHDPGRAHIAVFRYRQDDFTPYIFQTNDYGASWRRLSDGNNGIPADHFVRVVREDHGKKGLLYAGTEFGMYVSFDDGTHWQSLQLNLPVSPVTDLAWKDGDLVVATQGRAFWILDDVSPLQQLNSETASKAAYLFPPRDSHRASGFATTINYYLKEAPEKPITVEILDSEGEVINKFTSRSEAEGQGGRRRGGGFGFGGGGGSAPSAKAGMNRFAWNQRHEALFEVPRGIVMWGGRGAGGPQAVPGNYQVRLTAGETTATQPLTLKSDPRLDTTLAEYKEQYKLAVEVGKKIDELYDNLARIRQVKQQVGDIGKKAKDAGYGDELAEAAKKLSKTLTEIEGELTQLEGEGGQDALNFPGRLDNQWIVLYGDISGPDYGPRPGAKERYEDLKPQLSSLLSKLDPILKKDVEEFNKMVREKKIPAIVLASREGDES